MLPDVTVTVGKRMDLEKAGPGTASHTLCSGAEDKRPLGNQARHQQTLNLQDLLNLQASKLTPGCMWAKGSTRPRKLLLGPVRGCCLQAWQLHMHCHCHSYGCSGAIHMCVPG